MTVMRDHRLVVVSTHPIQYHTPWFRALNKHPQLDLQVWFCHNATSREQSQAGFGVEFSWDIDLLSGYKHQFLTNVAASPGVDSFAGLDTPELRDNLKSEQPSAVLVNGWHYKSAWQAIRACWQLKIPVMVRSDSHLHTERSLAKQFAKWPLYRWFIPRFDACIAVGSWSRDYFLNYGAKPQRVFCIPHTVDSARLNEKTADAQQCRTEGRQKWGIPESSIVFVFAGKFIEKKRPIDFIRAIQKASAQHPNVFGLMVGDGPLKPECERIVADHQLPVAFTGFLNQSEIASAFVSSDALILPSDGGETWGLVVNEAMTFGLPCFVSDHVGCGPDLVAGKNTGAIFRLGDCEELAKLVVDFSSDDKARETMSRDARLIAQEYSVDSAVSGTLQAVNAIVNH